MAQRPGSDGCGARAMVIHPRAARVRALDERCACARNASCCGTTAARAADGKRARRGLSITKYEALEHTCAKLCYCKFYMLSVMILRASFALFGRLTCIYVAAFGLCRLASTVEEARCKERWSQPLELFLATTPSRPL